MAAGCRAVPAVPTGSRLSSGRAAVTALVPLRNLLGHRALPAKISQGRAMAGQRGVRGLTGRGGGETRRNPTAVLAPGLAPPFLTSWHRLDVRNGSRFAGIEAAGAEGAGPPGSLGGGGGEMGGSRAERAEGGPPGGAPRPLRRPEGQGVTDGRPSPVALRRAAAERRGALLISPHSALRAKQKGGPKLVGRTGSP